VRPESDARHRGGHLRREAAAGRPVAEPVPDLERVGADARVEPGAPEQARRLGAVERADDEVLSEVVLATERAEQLDLLIDRLRLEARERNPRRDVAERRRHRIDERRSVGRRVAADLESRREHAVGNAIRGLVHRSHQRSEALIQAPRLRHMHTRRSGRP
jgi:hypothetical protein